MTRLHRRRLASFRPAIEMLEGRCCPTTVTNLMDSGPGSLRQAILDASSGDTVDFQPGLTGTITLTTGALAIVNKNLNIVGPGAGMVTVSGNRQSSVWGIALGNVGISGLTIADGTGGINEGQGTLSVRDCTFSGNITNPGPSGDGGAIADYGGVLNVNNCTFSGNSASSGGGIEIGNATMVMVNNCTFSGDLADGNGGGIDNNGQLMVNNCTFSGNDASSNGGGIRNNGTLHTRNTIIAVNTAGTGPDLSGSLGSSGHNLIGDGSGGSGYLPSDLVGRVAGLGPLQNNGGPTQTMAPSAGSLAIGAGDPTGDPATDQRGYPRIVGGTIDIGALQTQVAGVATHLTFDGPNVITAGTAFNVTVTARNDFGLPVTGYTGTVHFTLTGPVTVMADYTFTADDMGQHIFTNLVLHRAGRYTLAVADTGTPLITGSTTFSITAAAADHIAFSVPTTIPAGQAFAITVTVQDAYGNTVTDYDGTVLFALTGPFSALANYTFQADDHGSHTFNIAGVIPQGDYLLTGADAGDPFVSGRIMFTVSA
jgi:hypothetical protein